MVSGISNSVSMQPPMQSSQSLTNEQKETVSDIISNYDPSNMTKEDFESMMVEFQDAGIPASEDVGTLLDAAGFEKPEGGPEGAGGGKPPEPPEFMNELMEKLESGEITEEELLSFMEEHKSETGSSSGMIMDGYV